MVQVATRVDERVKREADAVYREYGLDIPTVLRMVLTMTANQKVIPVELQPKSDKYESIPPVDVSGRHVVQLKSDGTRIVLPEDFPDYLEEAWEEA